MSTPRIDYYKLSGIQHAWTTNKIAKYAERYDVSDPFQDKYMDLNAKRIINY